MRKNKNSPVKTYRFKSSHHRELFDLHKISFDEAVELVPPEPFSIPLTQTRVRKAMQYAKHYIYPEFFKADATRFLVTDAKNGTANLHRYLYEKDLKMYMSKVHITVYLTNVESI